MILMIQIPFKILSDYIYALFELNLLMSSQI